MDQQRKHDDDSFWRRPAPPARGEHAPGGGPSDDDSFWGVPGPPAKAAGVPGPPADARGAPSPDDAFWGVSGPAAEESTPGSGKRRAWVAALCGAAVIAVAAVVAINVGGSKSQALGTAGQGAGPGGGAFRRFGAGGPGGGEAGTIASINGSTITMTTAAGTTVTVLTSNSTAVTSASAGAVGDIKPGDNVVVRGSISGSTLAAEQITDSRGTTADGLRDGFGGAPSQAGTANAGQAPTGQAQAGRAPTGQAPTGQAPAGGFGGFGGFGGRPVAGVVKGVNGSSLTLAAEDGTTYTVTTSASTTVVVMNSSSVGALKVGDQIRVMGTAASNGDITASSIRAGEDAGLFDGRGRGLNP